MKCVICKKEAEYVFMGYSHCEDCLSNGHSISCYNLSKFPVELDDLCIHTNVKDK